MKPEILKRIHQLHADATGKFSTRRLWWGPTNVTYSSTKVGSILVVLGDDDSCYAHSSYESGNPNGH